MTSRESAQALHILVALPLLPHPVHNVIHRCSLNCPINRTCIMLFISCCVPWEGLVFMGVQLYMINLATWPPYMKLIVRASEPLNVPCMLS